MSTRRRRLRLANTMSEIGRRPIDDPEELRALGEMLVDLNEADRLLTRIHKQAIALGDDDIVHLLDSELFWKLRAAGDHLREHFDMERSHGGHM